MRILIAVLITAMIGVLAGWWLRDRLVPIPAGQGPVSGAAPHVAPQNGVYGAGFDVVRQSHGDPAYLVEFLDDTPESILILEDYFDRYGGDFGLYMTGVGTLRQLNEWSLAVEWLKAADLLSDTPEQWRQVGELLAAVTDDLARELTERHQYDDLIRLYEDISLTMPERVEFFLKLAEARIMSGDPEGALMPLAQIQNHSSPLGEQARQLIRTIEGDAVPPDAGSVHPLRRSGNQFVVRAEVDGRHAVSLLIDTGAALTIVDRTVLTRMGYSLDDQPVHWFATAGGRVEAPTLRLGSLTVGQNQATSLLVGALAMSLPSGVDGLLGMNFLRQFDFRIDQDRSLLLLENRARRPDSH
ncbi:MAG: retropepsin-like aspartic protease [Proteobacteria bacterium]|nr:retropepsin-like aspartic protease [Pseudomonadota bacterium]